MIRNPYRLKPILALALIAATMPATAAEGTASAPLSIQGTIRPKPCNLQFDNGGKIDFGSIDLNTLPSGPNRIKVGEQRVQFHVYCASEAVVHLQISDSRAGSADTSLGSLDKRFHYGLGKDEQDKNVGTYHIYFSAGNTTGDAIPMSMSASDDGSATWHKPDLPMAAPDRWFAWSSAEHHGPGAYRTMKASLLISVYLPPMDKLNLGTDIHLDGLSTFTIRYT